MITIYQISGGAKVLGGRAKRSTYFCQTKGHDERNGKKPQGKLSFTHLLKIQLTKTILHAEDHATKNYPAWLDCCQSSCSSICKHIHVPAGNLNVNKTKFMARLTL